MKRCLQIYNVSDVFIQCIQCMQCTQCIQCSYAVYNVYNVYIVYNAYICTTKTCLLLNELSRIHFQKLPENCVSDRGAFFWYPYELSFFFKYWEFVPAPQNQKIPRCLYKISYDFLCVFVKVLDPPFPQ